MMAPMALLVTMREDRKERSVWNECPIWITNDERTDRPD
jgi:hypothetical protein